MKTYLQKFLIGGLLLLSQYPVYTQEKVAGEPFWPKTISGEQGKLIIYQPQVESLEADKLEARAAVSVTMAEKPTNLYGAFWFECRIVTDYDERLVYLKEVKVTAARFPELEQDRIDRISRFLEAEVPTWDYVASLDELLVNLEGAEYEAELAQNLSNTPPDIIFATEPSALILIDGEPKYKSIEKTGYSYVVNTAFFIVQEQSSSVLYLKGGEYWFSSKNMMGDWKEIANPPKKVLDIAKQAVAQPEDKEALTDSIVPPVPRLYIRTKPAELIQTQGEPEFAPIEATDLLYVTNTTDYILMDIKKQEYYVLIAGRWYSNTSLKSPMWKYIAADQLPADFAKIPENSDIADVRASVAGTRESREAVLSNQIPQTAEVSRSEASLTVNYDGEPKFEDVGTTGMKYAVNTDKSVLLIDGKYYCCDEAIWFESASPKGPWNVSTAVPDKVSEIPPDNPTYNVKYVYIYDYTPDVVYVGYTPAYCHSYVYGPTVVYGTGYYYTPWYGAYYFPRPVTYGFGVTWNPYSGWGFTFGVTVGGPYGWFTFGRYSPYYGGYWGPVGYRHGYYHGYNRGYMHGYMDGKNPGSGGYYGHRGGSSTNVNNNIYNKRADRGSSGVRPSTRPSGSTRPTEQPSARPTTGTRPTTQPAEGARPSTRPANASMPNNVLTDREGNVYRKEGETWQKHQGGEWSNTSRPSTGSIERDYDQRQRAQQRTQTYQQNRSQYQQTRPSYQPSRSGSYNRPSAAPSNRGGAAGGMRGGRR
jgi:hypothetical protein